MVTEAEEETIGRKFVVTSIEKTDPPPGEEDGEWYEYVIGEGSSAITGKRAGTKRAVTRYIKEFTENLNQRSAMGYSAYATRKTAKKTASDS